MATTRHTRRTSHSAYPKRGEIYLVALDPTVGHEIRKTRPALIIQNDITNQYDATTMVAPITSTVRLPLSPVQVLLEAGRSTGLAVPSVAVFTQIRAIDRRRLIKKLGEASTAVMIEAEQAIQIAFGLAVSDSTAGPKTGRHEA